MEEFHGLEKLRMNGGDKCCCSKCKNYLDVVPNGWFHGELLFCKRCKLVFNLKLVDITKNAGEEYIENCIMKARIEEIKWKISGKNIDQVEKLLEGKQ